jgi:protein-S-isoprenylcysteine O-methyltransferase Ste14
VFVWAMMNLVVLPLSNVQRPKTFDPSQAIIAALILVVCIGLPVSLLARRHFGRD